MPVTVENFITRRDLFFVTPLVAMAYGWWIDHRRIESRNRAFNAAIRELGQAMEAHGFLHQPDAQAKDSIGDEWRWLSRKRR